MTDPKSAPRPCKTYVFGFAILVSVKKCALAHVGATLGNCFLPKVPPAWETHVFLLMSSYPNENSPLSFQKRRVYLGKRFRFPFLAGASPGADLEDLSRFWFLQSSIMPKI